MLDEWQAGISPDAVIPLIIVYERNQSVCVFNVVPRKSTLPRVSILIFPFESHCRHGMLTSGVAVQAGPPPVLHPVVSYASSSTHHETLPVLSVLPAWDNPHEAQPSCCQQSLAAVTTVTAQKHLGDQCRCVNQTTWCPNVK